MPGTLNLSSEGRALPSFGHCPLLYKQNCHCKGCDIFFVRIRRFFFFYFIIIFFTLLFFLLYYFFFYFIIYFTLFIIYLSRNLNKLDIKINRILGQEKSTHSNKNISLSQWVFFYFIIFFFTLFFFLLYLLFI